MGKTRIETSLNFVSNESRPSVSHTQSLDYVNPKVSPRWGMFDVLESFNGFERVEAKGVDTL